MKRETKLEGPTASRVLRREKSEVRMLTPSEIESLRRDKQQAAAKMLEAFSKLTPRDK